LQQKSYRPIHENGGTSTAVLKKKMFQDRNFIRESQPCISLRTQPEVGVGLSPQQGNTNRVLHLE
jgi:hypothetical protein